VTPYLAEPATQIAHRMFRNGRRTDEIAASLGTTEAHVANALARLREQRRAAAGRIHQRITQTRQCEGFDRDGRRCRRHALVGLTYCRRHAREVGVLRDWHQTTAKRT
jgi:hypothetical protein